jgi:hypothetical protein
MLSDDTAHLLVANDAHRPIVAAMAPATSGAHAVSPSSQRMREGCGRDAEAWGRTAMGPGW